MQVFEPAIDEYRILELGMGSRHSVLPRLMPNKADLEATQIGNLLRQKRVGFKQHVPSETVTVSATGEQSAGADAVQLGDNDTDAFVEDFGIGGLVHGAEFALVLTGRRNDLNGDDCRGVAVLAARPRIRSRPHAGDGRFW